MNTPTQPTPQPAGDADPSFAAIGEAFQGMFPRGGYEWVCVIEAAKKIDETARAVQAGKGDGRAEFEIYASNQGARDFEETSEDGVRRYCNPHTQGRWDYWQASRAALAVSQGEVVVESKTPNMDRDAAIAGLLHKQDNPSNPRRG